MSAAHPLQGPRTLSDIALAVLPGDGIGTEVTREAVAVLETAAGRFGFTLRMQPMPYGADHYLATGETVPPGFFRHVAETYHAVLVGAFGDPRVPDNRHAADILLGLRFHLDLGVNFRPARLYDVAHCPLRRIPSAADLDLVVFRENTEGCYRGVGGRLHADGPAEVALETAVHTAPGVARILEAAFAYAAASGLNRVVMTDKGNVHTHAGPLWARLFAAVGARYPQVARRHVYADTLACELVRDPTPFGVIVASNLLGDILSDLTAALVGGLGMAPSASFDPASPFLGLFEPVHGSSPPLAGQNVANPLGAILSVRLLLLRAGQPAAADCIERAVHDAIAAGEVTRDLGGPLGTAEAGAAVRRRMETLP